MFTAFADTARYLYGQIAPWARREPGIHVALIVGDGGNRTTLGGADYDDILTTEVVKDQAFSLELKVPNAETRAAMEESRAMMKARRARFDSAQALFDDLETASRR